LLSFFCREMGAPPRGGFFFPFQAVTLPTDLGIFDGRASRESPFFPPPAPSHPGSTHTLVSEENPFFPKRPVPKTGAPFFFTPGREWSLRRSFPPVPFFFSVRVPQVTVFSNPRRPDLPLFCPLPCVTGLRTLSSYFLHPPVSFSSPQGCTSLGRAWITRGPFSFCFYRTKTALLGTSRGFLPFFLFTKTLFPRLFFPFFFSGVIRRRLGVVCPSFSRLYLDALDPFFKAGARSSLFSSFPRWADASSTSRCGFFFIKRPHFPPGACFPFSFSAKACYGVVFFSFLPPPSGEAGPPRKSITILGRVHCTPLSPFPDRVMKCQRLVPSPAKYEGAKRNFPPLFFPLGSAGRFDKRALWPPLFPLFFFFSGRAFFSFAGRFFLPFCGPAPRRRLSAWAFFLLQRDPRETPPPLRPKQSGQNSPGRSFFSWFTSTRSL